MLGTSVENWIIMYLWVCVWACVRACGRLTIFLWSIFLQLLYIFWVAKWLFSLSKQKCQIEKKNKDMHITKYIIRVSIFVTVMGFSTLHLSDSLFCRWPGNAERESRREKETWSWRTEYCWLEFTRKVPQNWRNERTTADRSP
jgi:hypothetical protein